MIDPPHPPPSDPLQPYAALTVADSSSGTGAAAVERLVAGYAIEGELGRGGMGVVYRARQLSLNRPVALKMILHADHASEDQRQRFVHEAEALGRLRHPNIVQVFEAGIHDGTPFYSMEYVEGGNLNHHLRGAPLTPRDAAALLEVLARAVHHAHLTGIVHRDLKPANILLGRKSEIRNPKSETKTGGVSSSSGTDSGFRVSDFDPKVTDFGLAKDMGTEGQTLSGAILGTPSYMAPEQAAGKVHALGVRTDVYALGAILYECLTGRPPFRAASGAETIRLVLEQEAVSPRSLQPGVPRDLETICLRCLQKEPGKRYDSALSLAEDVKRFLDGEPIQARPISTAARAVRWLRKRPLVAGLLALVLLVASLGIGGFAWAFGEALAERNRAVTASDQANQSASAARKAGAEATREKGRAERGYFNSRIALAEASWRDGNVLLAHARLDEVPDPVRSWDWRHLKRTCNGGLFTLHGHQNAALSVAFDLEGRYLASAGAEGNIKIWDARDGRELRTFDGGPNGTGQVTFAPKGRLVGAGWDGKARIWDAATGRLLRILPVSKHSTLSVAVSGDGKRLAAGSFEGAIKIFDLATGQELRTLEGHVQSASFVSLSRDGSRLLSGGFDGTLRLWDVRAGREVLRLCNYAKHITSAALSPDGSRAAASSYIDPVIKVWDTYLGRELLSLHGHTLQVNFLTFSPDGQRIASASADGLSRIWDALDGREIVALRGHVNLLTCVSFSHDGQRIASTGWDQLIKVWDARESSAVSVFRGGPTHGGAIAFSPDSRRLAAVHGTSIRVYDDQSKQELFAILSPSTHPRALAFSPDGTVIAAGEQEGTVRLWDARTGQQRHVFRGHKGRVRSVVFIGDAQLATCGEDGLVRLWDTPAGRERLVLRGHVGAVNGIAVSKDGKHIISAGMDHSVRIWDVQTGKSLRVLQGHRGQVNTVAFSADGLVAASAGLDRFIKVWDVATGVELHSMAGHLKAVTSIAFHPEQYRLASGSDDRTVRVWDAQSGVELLSLSGHANSIDGVAFSSDGNWLASADYDAVARLWDGRPGQERATLIGHVGRVSCLVFSSSSRRLASGSEDGTVRIWDPQTGKEVHVLSGIASGVFRMEFGAGDQTILAQGGGEPVRAWNCETGQPWPKAPEQIEGVWRPRSPDGQFVAVPYDNVIRLFGIQQQDAEFRYRQGQTDLDVGWQEAEAARHEQAGHWHAAAFHVEQLLRIREKDAALHVRRAQLLMRLKRNDEALREVWRAMLIDPGTRVNLTAPPLAMPRAEEKP